LILHTTYNIQVFQTPDELNKVAAQLIIDIGGKCIAANGRFTLSLSGGETPKKLYALLSEHPYREQLEWKKTFVFWGDERCVPLNDERNNAYQAKLLLLNKIDIPFSNIYSIPVNLSPKDAGKQYEKELKTFFGTGSPNFDLILLGLGKNGHTASLFPGTKVIEEKAVGVREVYIEEEKMFRVTMTAPLINMAHHILFLINGKEKSEILNNVLTSSYQPNNYPAQLIKPVDGELYWFVDSTAGVLLKNR
jgi:6-phosphogluconolactonase